jgi:AcrR family transcriptional regulator
VTAAESREISPQRAAILDAAVAILREQGAAALTVRAVAAAAGCSTTGVYTWFGGKHGLVEAIFRDGFRRFGAAVDGPPDSDAEAHATAMAATYRSWALDNPTHYSVMFGHAVPDYQPSDEALVEALATFEPLVRAMAAFAAAEGLDADPTELATFTWATMHGYVSLEIAGMSVVDPGQREAAYASGIRRALAGCCAGARPASIVDQG